MKKVCPVSLSEDTIAYYTELAAKTRRSRSLLMDEALREAIPADYKPGETVSEPRKSVIKKGKNVSEPPVFVNDLPEQGPGPEKRIEDQADAALKIFGKR